MSSSLSSSEISGAVESAKSMNPEVKLDVSALTEIGKASAASSGSSKRFNLFNWS